MMAGLVLLVGALPIDAAAAHPMDVEAAWAAQQGSASAEDAVQRYYQAIARGDLRGAYGLLGERFQADQPYERFADGFATTREVKVEELRRAADLWDSSPQRTDETVYVRFRATDEGPGGRTVRTFAGTWQVQQRDGRWLLAAATIAPAIDRAELEAVLPPSSEIVRVADGDLRGTGANDVAAIIRRRDEGFVNTTAAIFRRSGGRVELTWLDDLLDERILVTDGKIVIADVNAEGGPELILVGTSGWLRALTVLRWEGGLVQTLFQTTANTERLGMTDLDGDGVLEILQYMEACQTDSIRPSLAYAHSWRHGGYRPSTAEYPSLQDATFGAVASATAHLRAASADHLTSYACLGFMEATAYALQGRAAEALTAYEWYLKIRPDPGDTPISSEMSLPGFAWGSQFQRQMRDVNDRIADRRVVGWGAREHAALHAMMANGLEAVGRDHQLSAEQRWRANQPDEYDSLMRIGDVHLDEAAEHYRAALALDPAGTEGRAGLARIRR